MAMEISSQNKISKYFTKYDLLNFNTINKCYVSLFGKVYDITDSICNNKIRPEAETLYKYAGKDVTHFFDPKTKKPYQMQRELQAITKSLPKERIDELKSSSNSKLFWYEDESLIVGKMTEREIKIRFVNTLNYIEHTLVVPIEETLNEICHRYFSMNKHAQSYTWKDINGCVLNMDLTLKDNGITERYNELEYINVPEEEIYLPTIYLYFNDDLTIM